MAVKHLCLLIAIAAGASLQLGSGLAAKEAAMAATATAIPESIKAEHHAIHTALETAMKAPGRVGAAARTLGAVLHPHFVREEEIALPPLGALAPLAAGTAPADATSLLRMTDTLRQELPQMLAEHVRIRAAVRALADAAKAEQAPQYGRLAGQLALHAQTEEEVLYPAAVLVGDLIRARTKPR